MSVNEEQAGATEHVAQRRDRTEEDGAVAAVEHREAAGLQRRPYARVHRLDHLQQCSLVEEAGQATSVGFGLDTTMSGVTRAPGRDAGSPASATATEPPPAQAHGPSHRSTRL